MNVILKSAKIVAPGESSHSKVKDILIEKGRIEKIDDTITKKGIKEISFDKLHVSPGWFDTSVCFGEPGYEERETIANGLLVAAKSGFTAVAVNPETFPVINTNAQVQFLIAEAQKHATSLYPIGALTKDFLGKELTELYDMKKHGAIAFGDYKTPLANANLMKLALLYAKDFDGLVLSYPQDAQIAGYGVVNEGQMSTRLGLRGIPALSEELQIIRDLALLEYTGGKLHIPTVSTEKSVTLIREAKEKKLDVSCSVAAHHLIWTDDRLKDFDSHCKVLPPLRCKNDVKALLSAVNDGTVDMITSDHNPLNTELKNVEFNHAAFGTIGMESLYGALQNILPTETIIKQIAINPRKRFGLPNPTITEGAHADLSLFNPQGISVFTEKNIYSASKNSIFLNQEVKGSVYGIYAKNSLIINAMYD